MTKLNPCPNCGSEPDISEMVDCFIVDCISCEGAVNQCRSRSASGAMNAWNAATNSEQAAPTEKTLRDEFAMAAIGGYMATESCLNSEAAEWAVAHSYEIADLMLKEREK